MHYLTGLHDVVLAVPTPTATPGGGGSHGGGAGPVLRTVIVVGVVGAVLLAWFLLRGYRGQGGQD
ncbi:hypothetical protein [Streptomyces buecherae]|uniref:Uncharacterized protein n=1 Tax=Streptomyces buecherae TaxID=2763006 RepID=A0A7H8N1A0_9ACTN|nr:hypothetical protein [Streptomyces buecherae]MBC3983768.1 hypothetical protein [Streptomyces buecherae]MBC3991501.1 hypothetical protein [Streptomyces buecherae]QKW48182.1 hypothetical protein HUT08_10135 [Streptomyces buecherae]QNJ44817.1 hypothetical protein H7H31_24555 [Streptomyces buecherae]